jgi:D-aminoacyl-tRNA deacylase
LCTVRIDPVLLGETVKSGEPDLIKTLEKLPLVHLSTQGNRLLPEFITYENHSSRIINDLNTLCVKIIRSNEITVTEKDTLILRKVRFDPHKARELGVPPGPSYKHLAEGQEVTIDGRVIMPAMVSSCSEIKIHIPGLEKYS